MIGIIGATLAETEALSAELVNKTTETVSGLEISRGHLNGKDVAVAVCGVGKVAAAVCCQTLILRYGTDLIINTGVAGSLSPKLHQRHIAVATGVVQHDMDISALGFPKGYLLGSDAVTIHCDENTSDLLSKCVSELDIPVMRGIVASGDQFIHSAAEKERIVDEFQAIACEMEGAAIGQVCLMNGVPFVVIRAISDEADGSSPDDYATFSAFAAKNSAKAVSRFLSRC